jgi:hypothetical protein
LATEEVNKIIFTTNDMLVKQIDREGPRTAKSFDLLRRCTGGSVRG